MPIIDDLGLALTQDPNSIERDTGHTGDRLSEATAAEVYVEFSDRLGRFLIGVLRDEGLAADALQTTFAKLIEKGAGVDPKSRKAWLFQVAYNEAMQIIRKRQTGKRAEDKLVWIKQAKEVPVDGEGAAIQSENAIRIRKALEELPETHRQVVELRIYEGLKFAEIAERLDSPLGTVLARMRTSLQKLKTILKTE